MTPTPTQSYRFELTHDVDFDAVNDAAAHKIAATMQDRAQEAIDKAVAAPHRQYTRGFRLVDRTADPTGRIDHPRVLRDSGAEHRAVTQWQRTKDTFWKLADEAAIFSFWTIAASTDQAWMFGVAAVTTGWWLRDVVTAAVARKVKHADNSDSP